MKKSLTMAAGVLVMLTFLTTNVKANPPNRPIIPTLSATSDLFDALVADKNFQELSFSFYELCGKLQVTKSIHLFQDYLQHTITDKDFKTLLTNLKFKTKEDLTEFFKKIYLQKIELQKKFSDLLNNGNSKVIIEAAAQKVASEQEFSKKAKYPTSLCWDYLVAVTTQCQFTCAFAEDWETCMDYCIAAAIASTTACFLFAD